jgi:hypothetical protein
MEEDEIPVDEVLAEQVRRRVLELYRIKGGKAFEENQRILATLDLRKEFLRSLEEGYRGFELTRNEENPWMNTQQRGILEQVIREKVITCGLHGIAHCWISSMGNPAIVTNEAPPEAGPKSVIIHHTLPDKMEKRVEELEKQQPFFRALQAREIQG